MRQGQLIGRLGVLALGLAASLPLTTAGTVRAAEVEIVRDHCGAPHIYAATTHDFLGYGYAVAEDRLFQMEMAKRRFTGRVAEVSGPDFVAHDKGTRLLSSPERIQRQIEELGPDDRAILAGYAAGVNRRIAEVLAPENRERLLPKQFADRGFEPSTELDGDERRQHLPTPTACLDPRPRAGSDPLGRRRSPRAAPRRSEARHHSPGGGTRSARAGDG